MATKKTASKTAAKKAKTPAKKASKITVTSPASAGASAGREKPAAGDRRFVLLSDLHAHNWSAFAKGDGAANSRLRASLTILRASLERAAQLDVPWVFGGDLVHTAGYTFNVVLAELVELFTRYPDVPKLAVWGNHDARGIGGRITLPQTVLAMLRRTVPQFVVLDPTVTPEWEDPKTGLTFSGAGYQPGNLHLGTESDVGIYHQTVRGTQAPGGFVLEEGVDPEALLERHRMIAVGHVHHPQINRAAKAHQLLLIPGSPEHHNFGDEGLHGWWVITMPANPRAEPQKEFIAGTSPEFRTVDTPADVRQDGHFYRVRSMGSNVQLPPGVVAVAPTPTVVQSRDILKGVQGDALLEAWMRHNPPKGVPMQADALLRAGKEFLQTSEPSRLRNARVRHIWMHNFCSYADADLQFKDGTWLILGKGRDFPSNGAGKSTLFEAIFWALFGRTTKGLSGDEVIRWGADDCAVSLAIELLDTETLLRVKRTRGKHATFEVVEHCPEGNFPVEAASTTELTEKLGKMLGLTPEIYQALSYFSQERLLLFASATDGERKEMLADLIGLQNYQEAATAAGQKAVECETRLTRVAALQDDINARFSGEMQTLDEHQARERLWTNQQADRVLRAQQALDEFQDLRGVEHARMVAESVASKTQEIEREQQVLTDQIAQKKGEAQELIQRPRCTLIELQEASAQDNEKRREREVAAVRMTEAQRAVEQAQRRLSAQQAKFTAGECPSCGQPITPEHRERCLREYEADVATAQAAVPALELAYHTAKAAEEVASRQYSERSTQWRNAEQLTRVANEVAQLQQRANTIQLRVASAQEVADSTVKQILDQRESALRDQAERLARETNPHTQLVVATRQRMERLHEEIKKHEDAQIVAEEEHAMATYWKQGFSKQGLQSLLVDEIAGLFNEMRGTIFPALTQGVYDVQFSTLSLTRSGEWREKTEFQVFERGALVNYAALSGGQRRRIDVGVMLTLVKAVAQWMGVPGVLGLLVLDEVLGFLDASGAEGLMEALHEVQAQVPTVFVVSHEAQVQALFPNTLVVSQDDAGISHLSAESVG